MVQHKVIWMVVTVIGLVVLAGCTKPMPSADQFQTPAVGTPMPGGHEESVQPDFSVEVGGALFVNQTGYPLQVAVNNTITRIQIGEDFLFILPPGTYEFYVYQPDVSPRIHTERIEGGKIRYVYWFPQTPG